MNIYALYFGEAKLTDFNKLKRRTSMPSLSLNYHKNKKKGKNGEKKRSLKGPSFWKQVKRKHLAHTYHTISITILVQMVGSAQSI